MLLMWLLMFHCLAVAFGYEGFIKNCISFIIACVIEVVIIDLPISVYVIWNMQ